MTTTMSPFHDRLAEAAGKTSYRKLGKMTETHPETVRRYMQGQTPSSSYIIAFCDALGIAGDWLLMGKGPKMRNQVRTHALKSADASELLNAIADTLTALTARVETMERFMQSLKTKLAPVLRAHRDGSAPASGILVGTKQNPEDSQGTDEREPGQSGDLKPADAIERIRATVVKRASAPAD